MQKFLFPLAAAVLAAAVLFGGGAARGLASDPIPQLAALPLLALCVGPAWVRLGEWPVLRLCLAGLILLPLLQLAPLPRGVWLSLPGRDAAGEAMALAGVEPEWLALSLRPGETWRSLAALLPGVSLFLAVVCLDLKRRVWLACLLVALAFLSIFVGIAQLLSGPGSALYFYSFTNPGRAVALFANANHFTALLYATLPVAVALFADRDVARSPSMMLVLAFTVFVFLVGLSVTGSRTAAILGGFSLVLSGAFIARGALAGVLSKGRALAALGLAVLTVAPILLGAGLLAILRRFEDQDLLEDARWSILPASIDLLWRYFPVGSGFGSFERAYQAHEAPSILIPNIVNHVHNDWVEAAVEGGLPAVALLALWLIGLASISARVLVGPSDIGGRLAKAGVIALWALTVHSLWDYPLRTMAMGAIFGAAAGLVFRPASVNVASLAEALPGLGGKTQRRRRRRSRSSGGPRAGEPVVAPAPASAFGSDAGPGKA